MAFPLFIIVGFSGCGAEFLLVTTDNNRSVLGLLGRDHATAHESRRDLLAEFFCLASLYVLAHDVRSPPDDGAVLYYRSSSEL